LKNQHSKPYSSLFKLKLFACSILRSFFVTRGHFCAIFCSDPCSFFLPFLPTFFAFNNTNRYSILVGKPSQNSSEMKENELTKQDSIIESRQFEFKTTLALFDDGCGEFFERIRVGFGRF
jgi:hypothetical protein